MIFGQAEGVSQDDYNDSVKAVKDFVKALNARVSVDQQVTMADLWIAASLATPYLVLLDSGFQKGMANCTALFSKIYAIPEFMSVFGQVKMCQKPMNPASKLIKVEKPKPAAK